MILAPPLKEYYYQKIVLARCEMVPEQTANTSRMDYGTHLEAVDLSYK